jgi:hypothetical protein
MECVGKNVMPAAYLFVQKLVSKSQSEIKKMQSKSKKFNAHLQRLIGHEPWNPSRGNRQSVMFYCPARYHQNKKGRQHSKLHRVHMKSTYNSPKVLLTHLFELKVPLLHMAHTPHSGRHMETIGGKTVVLLQAWLLSPFLAKCNPRLPGKIPNANNSSGYFSIIR